MSPGRLWSLTGDIPVEENKTFRTSELTLFESIFARLVEHGDHILEVHAGAVERRHREREVGVAGFDRNGKALQMSEELREIRGAVPGERR